MKNLVIVGNQINLLNDYSKFIDNSDYVIRFNKIDNYNKNTGSKIDELVCRYANAYDIIHGFDNNFNYLHNINFKKIKLTLVLNNFNDLKGLEVANNVCKKNNISNLNIIYNNLNDSYLTQADTTLASTGKILIEHIIKNKLYSNYNIYIVGFNWFNINENNGHMWKLEREQINNHIKNNLIKQLK